MAVGLNVTAFSDLGYNWEDCTDGKGRRLKKETVETIRHLLKDLDVYCITKDGKIIIEPNEHWIAQSVGEELKITIDICSAIRGQLNPNDERTRYTEFCDGDLENLAMLKHRLITEIDEALAALNSLKAGEMDRDVGPIPFPSRWLW